VKALAVSAREEILKTIRRHLPEASPLPSHDGPWIEYPDPIAQFSAVLEMIGGQCFPVRDIAAVNQVLESLPLWNSAEKRLSLIPGVGESNVEWDTIQNPHDLEDVDFAILPAEFAVAENAAVWVTDRALRHRVIYFLCEHLAVVVPRSEVLSNLNQAYQRLSFTEPRFGAFIAGPSKTADIEQSLVIGAHGPRSMTVFLVG